MTPPLRSWEAQRREWARVERQLDRAARWFYLVGVFVIVAMVVGLTVLTSWLVAQS